MKISSQPQTLESPAHFVQVVPESLTVTVNLDGYETQNIPLALKARENREMDVTLVALAEATEQVKEGWTWRGYARVSAFVAAAGFLGAGLLENKMASDRADDYNNLAVRTQKDRDAALHSGFRMRFDMARYSLFYEKSLGIALFYEMNRGNLFGMETGHTGG